MVKKISSESRNLSYRVYSDESYLETDMEDFGPHLCGRFFEYLDLLHGIYQVIKTTMKKILALIMVSGSLLIANVALASWWNPLSWFQTNTSVVQPVVSSPSVISPSKNQPVKPQTIKKPATPKSPLKKITINALPTDTQPSITTPPQGIFPPGCTSNTGFSLSTGASCQTKNTDQNISAPLTSSPQTSLPPATSSQLAGLTSLCNVVETQSPSSDTAKECISGTMLTWYNSNAIFRANIDSLAQTLQQKQQSISNNYLSTQQQIQQQQTASQLLQLQNSIDANKKAVQQQQDELKQQMDQEKQQQYQYQQQQYQQCEQQHQQQVQQYVNSPFNSFSSLPLDSCVQPSPLMY